MTSSIVIAWITHAYVVGYHAFQNFLIIKCHVAKLYRSGNIVCLYRDIKHYFFITIIILLLSLLNNFIE